MTSNSLAKKKGKRRYYKIGQPMETFDEGTQDKTVRVGILVNLEQFFFKQITQLFFVFNTLLTINGCQRVSYDEELIRTKRYHCSFVLLDNLITPS